MNQASWREPLYIVPMISTPRFRSVLPAVYSRAVCLLSFLFSSLVYAGAQGTVPTIQYTAGNGTLVLAGRDPVQGGTLTIPTVLVPVTLAFEAKKAAGKAFQM